MIRSVKLSDASRICEIYNYYIKNTVISFEEEIVSPTEMEQRIKKIRMSLPWIVLVENNIIQGYAYAAPWRVRSAYRYSVESTIYLGKDCIGRGYGKTLYTALLDDLAKRNIHSVIAGITLPNEASIGLHESLGFRKCAVFSEVGCKMEKWIDVGYWEKLFDFDN